MKLSDFSKTTEQLENGQENIARRLSSLPRTEHDPYTFTVDVLYYTVNVKTSSVRIFVV